MNDYVLCTHCKHGKWNTRLLDPKYVKWRNQVIKIQETRCAKCGTYATHVHHILNYKSHPQLRHTVSNGILLCKECHVMFHDTYGVYNNTIEQLQTFLNISPVRPLYI